MTLKCNKKWIENADDNMRGFFWFKKSLWGIFKSKKIKLAK